MAGDTVAREQLPAELERKLLRLARKCAPRLAPDQQEEVAQQFWRLIFEKPSGSFDPGRGTAMDYMVGVMRTAARDVSRDYAPPGVRTRPQKHQPRAPLASLDALIGRAEEVRLGDVIPAVEDAIAEADSRMSGNQILKAVASTGSLVLAKAVEQIACGLTITEAGAAVGWTRLQLRRRLDAWARAHPEARPAA
jgi:hypothetical protein